MTELEALRAGILEFPDCDTRRGIYADALQETEDPNNVAYAEFIRVQIELANFNGCHHREQAELPPWCLPCHQRYAARRRERELWLRVRDKFFSHSIATPIIDSTLVGFMSPPGERSKPILIVHRGFVDKAIGTLEQLRGRACSGCSGAGRTRHYHPVEIEAVEDCSICNRTGRVKRLLEGWVSRDPITKLRVTDKRPAHRLPYGKEMWTWFGPPGYAISTVGGMLDESRLPYEIWQALPHVDYDNQEDAERELCKAVLNEAKERR